MTFTTGYNARFSRRLLKRLCDRMHVRLKLILMHCTVTGVCLQLEFISFPSFPVGAGNGTKGEREREIVVLAIMSALNKHCITTSRKPMHNRGFSTTRREERRDHLNEKFSEDRYNAKETEQSTG